MIGFQFISEIKKKFFIHFPISFNIIALYILNPPFNRQVDMQVKHTTRTYYINKSIGKLSNKYSFILLLTEHKICI